MKACSLTEASPSRGSAAVSLYVGGDASKEPLLFVYWKRVSVSDLRS